MPASNELPDTVTPRNRLEWRAWLKENHDSREVIWLIFYKKGSSQPTVAYEAAVEEALCFGWVDSTVRTVDSQRYMQRFTPRKPGSLWAKSNKERVARLIEQGLMTPAGLAKIEAAKQDGSWTRAEESESEIVPPDLAKALAEVPAANANFRAFPPSSRKNILVWIASSKRPETRMRRIAQTVELAAQTIRANQPQPGAGSAG